jgi:hypothetical protein
MGASLWCVCWCHREGRDKFVVIEKDDCLTENTGLGGVGGEGDKLRVNCDHAYKMTYKISCGSSSTKACATLMDPSVSTFSSRKSMVEQDQKERAKNDRPTTMRASNKHTHKRYKEVVPLFKPGKGVSVRD